MAAGALASETPPPAEAPVRWAVDLFGRSTDDSLSSSQTVGTALWLDLQKNLSDDFYGHIRAVALLEAGSSSSLFTDEFQPLSHLALVDARLRWTVVEPLSFTVGALYQDILLSPLLISVNTFPAGLASLRFHPSHWYIEGHAQAAIPTGFLLTTKSVGKEPMPELFTQTAILGWRRNPDYFVEAKATHFDFVSLTHGMAEDARFYGNTVAGIADASAFVYGYQGYELDTSGSLPLGSHFALVAGGSFVRNPQAPAATNSGYYGYGGFTLLGDKFRLRPVAEYYENQADASPAFFSSRDFGHNNRRGYGGKIELSLKKPALELALRARNADLITQQPFQQNDFRYYDFTISLPYAPL